MRLAKSTRQFTATLEKRKEKAKIYHQEKKQLMRLWKWAEKTWRTKLADTEALKIPRLPI